MGLEEDFEELGGACREDFVMIGLSTSEATEDGETSSTETKDEDTDTDIGGCEGLLWSWCVIVEREGRQISREGRKGVGERRAFFFLGSTEQVKEKKTRNDPEPNATVNGMTE